MKDLERTEDFTKEDESFTTEDYLNNLNRLFDCISKLDYLFNYDYMNIEEYTKIKNRILDEIVELRNYAKEILKG